MNKINKLLTTLNLDTKLAPLHWEEKNIYCAGKRKWIGNIVPSELLRKSVKDAINTLMTLNQSEKFHPTFPNEILTPNYGDKWGIRANFIEINNRAIAEMHNERSKNGILSTIKLLPAIPPSAKSWANCIILSQIFPNIYGDGYNKPAEEENSIYGIKLNAGYSANIINFDIFEKFSSEEQLQTFNLLANFHG